jgi:uncharacterized protein GlcG (DUF336 family)
MSGALTLEEAKEIIDRAIEKATELGRIESFVVVDEGGHVLSASCMDGAPPGSVPVARAKAYLVAMLKAPTAPFGDRMHVHLERFHAWQALLPEPIFPGPGGMPIVRDGRVVGALSSSVAVTRPGADRSKLIVDGEKRNAEDYVIAHALQIPYRNQHGPSTYLMAPLYEG